jgi:hypothetical protein
MDYGGHIILFYQAERFFQKARVGTVAINGACFEPHIRVLYFTQIQREQRFVGNCETSVFPSRNKYIAA